MPGLDEDIGFGAFTESVGDDGKEGSESPVLQPQLDPKLARGRGRGGGRGSKGRGSAELRLSMCIICDERRRCSTRSRSCLAC